METFYAFGCAHTATCFGRLDREWQLIARRLLPTTLFYWLARFLLLLRWMPARSDSLEI